MANINNRGGLQRGNGYGGRSRTQQIRGGTHGRGPYSGTRTRGMNNGNGPVMGPRHQCWENSDCPFNGKCKGGICWQTDMNYGW